MYVWRLAWLEVCFFLHNLKLRKGYTLCDLEMGWRKSAFKMIIQYLFPLFCKTYSKVFTYTYPFIADKKIQRFASKHELTFFKIALTIT